MPNKIATARNYTSILDQVYQREATSTALNSPARLARAGKHAKEIIVRKIEVSGLGDYTRNVGYKTSSIGLSYETKTFNYDRGIKLLADVMDVEEAGVMDYFVQAGASFRVIRLEANKAKGRNPALNLHTWRTFRWTIIRQSGFEVSSSA